MSSTDYRLLAKQLEAFIDTEPFYVPVFANASALLYHAMPDLNWAGFYIVREDKLVLGPFQGKTACILIGYGRGVCGTAWEKNETQLVPDVHAFPGHIACDSASRSEIVVPLHDVSGAVTAVLDIDSPLPARFAEEDKEGLEQFVKVLEKGTIYR